jgi:hypothetical protein
MGTYWQEKYMASPARIVANQNNAQLSTGPRTEAGKARVSRNAATHGLTSKKFVLASEDQAAFEQLREGILESWRPVSEQEHQLAELLAQAQWRLSRLRTTETAFLDQCVAEILEQQPELDPDQALAFVFISPVHAKRLSLFLRYQTSIERAYNKAKADLEQAQKQRRQNDQDDAIAETWTEAAVPEPVGFVSQPQPHSVPLDRIPAAGIPRALLNPEDPE